MLTFFAVAMLALQIADVWSTERAMERGLTEANPFVDRLMELFGPWWWFPKVVVASVVVALLYAAGAVWALGLMCAAYAALIVWNLWATERHK